MLAADLVRARVPTIVFGQSRNSVEVMLRYLRDAGLRAADGRSRADRSEADHGLPRRLPPRAAARDRAAPARGGDPRRGRHQRPRARASTSASSTRSSARGTRARSPRTWQRFGRAGRRGEQSIGVLVDVQRAARPVPRARAEDLLRRPGGGGAHRPGQRRDPHPAPEVRRVRDAFRVGEAFGSLGADETARRALVLLDATACSTSRTARSTGRRTPIPRTTSRSAAWAGTTSSSST